MNWYLIKRTADIKTVASLTPVAIRIDRTMVIPRSNLIPTVFIPDNKKVEGLLQAALTENSLTPELSAALNDKKNQVAHQAEEIIILVIAALMALKPF